MLDSVVDINQATLKLIKKNVNAAQMEFSMFIPISIPISISIPITVTIPDPVSDFQY